MSGAFRVSRDTVDPTDIRFEIVGASVPAEQAQLRDEVDSALTVLRSIFPPNGARFEEHFRQLLALAQAGLVGETANPDVASRALKGLKEDITAREAGRIKNQYLRKTGIFALIAIGVLSAIIALLRAWKPTPAMATNLLLLEIGAMAGVWLSFGTRKALLKFEDLGVLEEDRLDPMVRLVFAGLLTLIIALTFALRVVVVTMGAIRTDQIVDDPLVALLIGMLCGVSEKALSSNVTKQASNLFK